MEFTSRRSNSAASATSRPGRAWSWNRQAEPTPPKPKSGLKQGSFSIYRLQWEKLKAFLEQKFPGHTFEERKVLKDRYYFEVPESLTSVDKLAIEDLRDKEDPGQDPGPRRISEERN